MAADYGVRAAAHRRALDVAPRIFGSLLPERCRESVASAPLDRWPRPQDAQSSVVGSAFRRLEPSPVVGSAVRRIAPAEAGGHEAASGRSDRCLLEIAATPGFGSPFEWRLIARLSNGYFVRTINLVRVPTGEGAAGRTLVPNVWTPAVIEAARTRPAQVFLGFSRFPAVRLAVDQQGVATVQWTDIRFSGGPDPPRPRNDGRGDLFGARVRIAPDGRILEAQLGGR
jgi:hypothetical protein